MTLQIRRTATPNAPPPNGSLAPGQLAVEMASAAPRLWVGTDPALAYTGNRRLVIDSGGFLPLTGGILTGDLEARNIDADGDYFGRGNADLQMVSNSSAARLTLRRARGTAGPPEVITGGVLTNDSLGDVTFAGYYSGTGGAHGATIEGVATQDWTVTNNGTALRFFVTANNTIAPQVALTIDEDSALVLPNNYRLRSSAPNDFSIVNPDGGHIGLWGGGEVAISGLLDVGQATLGGSSIAITSMGNNAAVDFSMLRLRRGRGTATTTRTPVQNNDELGSIQWDAIHTNNSYRDAAAIRNIVSENWTATANGNRLEFLTTANGTTANRLALTLDEDGQMVLPSFGAIYLSGGGTPPRHYQISTQGTDVFWVRDMTQGPAVRMAVDSAGTCYNITGTWNMWASDSRAKCDVAPYKHGLTEILQLSPVSYKFNGLADTVNDGSEHVGLLADAVQPVMPEMVGMRRGKLNPEDTSDQNILTLDNGPLLYAMVNAIQELSKQVTKLQQASAGHGESDADNPGL